MLEGIPARDHQFFAAPYSNIFVPTSASIPFSENNFFQISMLSLSLSTPSPPSKTVTKSFWGSIPTS
jgi:hypothetical protein